MDDTAVLEHYLAPLRPLLAPEDVTELVINRPGEVGIEQGGRWHWHEKPLLTEAWLRTLAVAAAAFTKQDVSDARPICSTILPGDERCQIVLPPAAPTGTVSLTIRKPSRRQFGLDAFATGGLFDAVVAADDASADPVDAELLALKKSGDWSAFFKLAVVSRRNILVSGATGSGKTTFAKGLVEAIPDQERLLTIEDTRELVVPHRNVVHLTYSKEGQGLAQVTAKSLLESALRMRPDRILLQELRDGTAFFYLRNVNSGHPGSITTVHADSASLAFEQLTLLVRESEGGRDLPREDIRALLHLLVDIVVQMRKTDGRFRVTEVWHDPLRKRQPAARTTLVVVGVLLLLLVAGTSTAMIALAGVGRLSPDIDPVRVPAWLWHYRADPDLQRWLRIGGLTNILLAVVLVAAVALGIRRPLHGAARWASTRDLKAAGLAAREGILLGRRGRSWLIAGGSEHVMLYAPTRTGKGVGVVIPNLLTWPGSVVVLDIKRENHAATAGFRAAAGQTVLLFDPLAPDGRTARFNPLAHIERFSTSAVLDELQRMAVMLFPGHDHADPFWSEAARTGFIGVGAYVAETPDLPFSLGEIFRQLTEGDARERFPGLIKARNLAGAPLSNGCASALTDFCSSSENTFASIRQTITSRMGLWLNPAVDAATSASDFDLRDLREGRLSLYLGASPDNMLRVAPLYSLLFQQLVDLNSRRLPRPDDRPVLVLLDEFARLGRAPVLAAAFSYLAGYGIRLLPVIQSPSQLRALYGPDVTEDILTNCGIEVVFAPKELKVAQELSERLGYYTYQARSRSRPMGLGSGRRSTTTSDQRRALMMPQELMQLPDRTLIVLKAGMPPARGAKIRFFREQVFTRRQRPAPIPPGRPVAAELASATPVPPPPALEDTDMSYESVVQAFTEQGCPPPEIGATETEVADWLDQIIDAIVPAPDRDDNR